MLIKANCVKYRNVKFSIKIYLLGRQKLASVPTGGAVAAPSGGGGAAAAEAPKGEFKIKSFKNSVWENGSFDNDSKCSKFSMELVWER